MEMDKSPHPMHIGSFGTKTVMLVADAFAKLIQQPHGGQWWVVGFASNFNTVHKYSIIRQLAVLQRFYVMYFGNVNKRAGMLTGVFAV